MLGERCRSGFAPRQHDSAAGTMQARRYNETVAGLSDAVSVSGDGNRVRNSAFDCAALRARALQVLDIVSSCVWTATADAVEKD